MNIFQTAFLNYNFKLSAVKCKCKILFSYKILFIIYTLIVELKILCRQTSGIVWAAFLLGKPRKRWLFEGIPTRSPSWAPSWNFTSLSGNVCIGSSHFVEAFFQVKKKKKKGRGKQIMQTLIFCSVCSCQILPFHVPVKYSLYMYYYSEYWDICLSLLLNCTAVWQTSLIWKINF